MKHFGDIFCIQPEESDVSRRKKILNSLVVIIFFAVVLLCLSLFIILFFNPPIYSEMEKLLRALVLMVLLMPLIYVVNRKSSSEMAALLFLISFLPIIYMADEPVYLLTGRSLVFFTLPILLAPFISRPISTLIMTTVITLSLILFGAINQIQPNIIVLIYYWIFGTIIWIISSINRSTFMRLKEIKENYKSAVMEKIQTEAALRNSEERYRTFVDSFKGIVYLKSMSGKALFFHGAVEELTGYQQNDFLENPDFWKQHIHPEDIGKWEALQTKLSQTINFSTEIQYRHKDSEGKYHWFQEFTQNLNYESGKPAFVQGIIYDISHSKAMEDQLQQSLKMDALGRLAGGVAHDFNNILTSILGYCQIMGFESTLSQSVKENLKEIQKASERAVSLTDQLLSFSRKKNRDMRSFSLGELVISMKKMIKRLIDENITIRYDIDTHIANIRADMGQIEQVLLNLTINARDAMPQGGEITIRIKEARLDNVYCSESSGVEANSFVMLEVVDSGMGIDKDTLNHIYEPFYSTKGNGQGTGLGLSIVFGIVKQNNGHIICESEPGRGTAFRVYLPACYEKEESSQEEVMGDLPPGNECILLVEDDETLRKMIFLVLEHLGYHVITATDGVEAMAKAQKLDRSGIDLLITDVVMPKMDGRELYLALIKYWPRMKTLFISGYRSHLLDDIELEPGKTDFLPKPFSSKTLAARVRALLNSVLQV
ncbi:MAG: response regulator [Spirochaetales bacterium]|nr:response regulator [Spirochaetales bacterium]